MKIRAQKIAFFILMLILLSGCYGVKTLRDTSNPPMPKGYADATESDLLLGQLTNFRICYDVHFYDLKIRLFPDLKYITGKVTISSSVVQDFDTLQIDLYRNLEINSIILGTDPGTCKFYRKENSVFVIMPHHFKVGERFSLSVTYEGSPVNAKKPPWQGGFSWKQDKNKNPWIGVSCQGEGPGIWWPSKDHGYDEPDSAAISVTVPDPLIGVSNGVLKKQTTNKDSTTTYDWFVSYPINSYNLTVYAGAFVEFGDTLRSISGNILKLSYYVLPDDLDSAKRQFEQVKPILHFYESMFGEYPWQRDGYKLVEAPFAGMEHQSAIAYGAGFKNIYPGGWDHLILHETAHEWWGNSLTALDGAEGWLHEGFATYSEDLYVEKYYPKNKNALMFWHRSRIKNLRPVIGPSGRKFFYEPKIDSDIYMKGSTILNSLRWLLKNDSLFFDILKSFATTYRQSIVTTADFIKIVNEKSGRDLNWFFDQYLRNRYVPVLELSRHKNKLYYRWTHTINDFQLPVILKMDGVEKEIYPSSNVQIFYIADNVHDFTVSLKPLILVERNITLRDIYDSEKWNRDKRLPK